MLHMLLTTGEVASMARVTTQTVRRWAQSGQLPALRIGGVWRFRRDDVEALLTPVTPDQEATA